MANSLIETWKSTDNWFQDFQMAYNGTLLQPNFRQPFGGISTGSGDLANAYIFANNNLLNNQRLTDRQIKLLETEFGNPWQRNDQIKFKEGSLEFTQLLNQKLNEIGRNSGAKTAKSTRIDLEAHYSFPFFWQFDELNFDFTLNHDIINTQNSYFMDNNGDISVTDIHLNSSAVYISPWSNNLIFFGDIDWEFNTNFGPFASPSVRANYLLETKTNAHKFSASYRLKRRVPTIDMQYKGVNLGNISLIGGWEDAFKNYSETIPREQTTFDYEHITSQSYQSNSVYSNPVKWKYSALTPEIYHYLEGGYQTTLFGNLELDTWLYFNLFQNYIKLNEIKTTFDKQISSLNSGRYKTFFIFQNDDKNLMRSGFQFNLKYPINQYFHLFSDFAYHFLNKGNDYSLNIPDMMGKIRMEVIELEPNLLVNTQLRYRGAYPYQSILGQTNIPDAFLLDFEIGYIFPQYYTTLKLGADNVLNNSYHLSTGSSLVGAYYYLKLRHNF